MPCVLLSEEAQSKLVLICRAVKRSKSKEDAIRTAIGSAISAGALPPEYAGKSMTEISDGMDITRAAVSKKAKGCQIMFGLPPSHYMKAESASKSFREARIRSIKEHQ